MTVTTEFDPTQVNCVHCHGTGHEPLPTNLTAGEALLLAKIAETGARLKTVSDARTDEGVALRRKCYADLRRLAERARKGRMTKPLIAAAAGLSRQGLHNILEHRVKG